MGFHWHEVDEKSMCRLYSVEVRTENGERELAKDRHFATIERKDGSCKDNGRHLLEFVFDLKEQAVLSANALWGLMLPVEMKQLEYVPSFAYVDKVPVSVGMLPIAQQVVAPQSWVPAANWKEWLYGEVNHEELAQFAIDWQGIEAKGVIESVEIDKWNEWVKILPYQIVTTVSLDGWRDVKGYADTPPVSVKQWQDWIKQGPHSRTRLFSTSSWQQIGPLDDAMLREIEKGKLGEATAAAIVSTDVYGTPVYGTLIATICPVSFLTGRTSCMLPEFEHGLVENVYGESLKFLRVPFLEVSIEAPR